MRAILFPLLLLPCLPLAAQEPFLTQAQWSTLTAEISGAVPYQNLSYLTTLHRVPATAAFQQAAEFIKKRALEYGLSDTHTEDFPIDGTRTYGLMRSNLAWTARSGQLWEVHPQHLLLGDITTDPIRLADYSHSASVETSLVDVGNGTAAGDYLGKEVRGKIVLADGTLSRVQQLAVTERGAAGIVSDMPNQPTAWSGLDPTLVRWGHLDARQPGGFAFMISRQTASLLRSRLAAHEDIVLNAQVEATVGPGHWTVVTGTIPGSNPAAGEVVFTCHLDHQRPGANDNGSGCVDILEVARTLQRLIHSGALPPPMRTIRFIWGPEHEGTMAFLAVHPEIMKNLRANVHMDMVGGDPFKNKSILHVTETPWSLPSFVTDVGAVFLETIRSAAARYAESGTAPEQALLETTGTRNEFLADVTPFETGSDHDDYDSSTIAVPSLYLRDWPDLYIHTDHDSLEQIDPTKLRRVAALGAASGYVYATLQTANIPFFTSQAEARLAKTFQQAQKLLAGTSMTPDTRWYEARNLMTQSLHRESQVIHSAVVYCGGASEGERAALNAQVSTLNGWLDEQAKSQGAKEPSPPWSGAASLAVPQRIAAFGPVDNQYDDALLARLGPERESRIKLAGLYPYEILNFVDGKRNVGEIRDAVSAELGPVEIGLVVDYLNALEEAKIISMTPAAP